MRLYPTHGRPLLVAIVLLLSSCGDPPGTACVIEGSGFTATDNCRYRCLQYRPITCPDQRQLNPQVCSGKPGCAPGDCGAGELCYTVLDPFNEESYCIAADTCGPLTAAEQAAFEQTTLEEAQALRARYQERQRRREAAQRKTGGATTTAPADQ